MGQKIEQFWQILRQCSISDYHNEEGTFPCMLIKIQRIVKLKFSN